MMNQTEQFDTDEDLIARCLIAIQQENKASTSLLQRRFRIGFSRASFILGILEQRGHIGPLAPLKPRKVNEPTPQAEKREGGVVSREAASICRISYPMEIMPTKKKTTAPRDIFKQILIASVEAQLIRLECEIEAVNAQIQLREMDADLAIQRGVLLGTKDRLSVQLHKLRTKLNQP